MRLPEGNGLIAEIMAPAGTPVLGSSPSLRADAQFDHAFSSRCLAQERVLAVPPVALAAALAAEAAVAASASPPTAIRASGHTSSPTPSTGVAQRVGVLRRLLHRRLQLDAPPAVHSPPLALLESREVRPSSGDISRISMYLPYLGDLVSSRRSRRLVPGHHLQRHDGPASHAAQA